MKFTRPAPDATMPFGLRASLRRMRRRPLVWLAVGWAVGAVAGYSGGAAWFAYVLPALVFAAAAFWSRRLSALCAAFIFIAASVTGVCAVRPENLPEGEALLRGVVCSETRQTDEYRTFTLTDISLDGEAYPHDVRIYLYPYGQELPAIRYGDTLSVSASLSAPRGTTGEGDYDTAAYYWRSGVALTAYATAEDLSVSEGGPSFMRSAMLLRERISQKLASLYPENSALAQALLLGDKSLMTDAEYASFTDAGIVHLLAVSGLHVTILAEALRLLLQYVFIMPRKAAYFIVMPVLFVYAALTGFPASILRAILCFALVNGAPLTDRPADRLTGLSLSFLILCFIRPLSMFDAGFLLSFSAMAGICTFAPVFASALTPAFMLRTPVRKLLWAPVMTVVSSLSATMGTLPVAAMLFGKITLWSLLANTVAIPLTTALLPVLFLSLVHPHAAFVGEIGLSWLDCIAAWFGELPDILRMSVARMPWGFTALYALIVILCCAQVPRDHIRKKAVMRIRSLALCALILVTTFSGLWTGAPVMSENGLSITFIDVGQGDSALINAQGLCYMVDTGENSSAADRLSSRAIRLSGLFITHPDDDHALRIADVIESGHVQTVYLPECWPLLDVPAEIGQALSGVDIVYLSAGDTVPLSDDVTATVLHPPKGYIPPEDNAASLVLLVEYGSGSALLMGDLADEDITFTIPDCDLIKLSHHGSATASGSRLLRAVSPSAAIVSAGAGNSYGHPAPEVLARLEELSVPVFSTAQCGDITADIMPQGGLNISSYLENENGG